MFIINLGNYLIRRNLQHLILHVTNKCNFRCNHCFVDFTETNEPPLLLLKERAKEIGPLFWLDIGGGEPFLRDDLADIIASFNAKVTMIPSNGFQTDRIVDQISEIQRKSPTKLGISLSIEGSQQTNDLIRKEGSWDAVWKTFEQVRKIDGLSVKINTVLSRENANEILPLMDTVYEFNPDFHSIILLRGTPKDSSMMLPELPVLRNIIPEIIQKQERYNYGKKSLSARILRNYHRYAWELSLKILNEKRQVIPCLAGSAHMVINADGSVSSCEMLAPFGNIHQANWTELMKSDEYRMQRKSIINNECHCTHNCAMIDSVLFRPASLPRLLLGGQSK